MQSRAQDELLKIYRREYKRRFAWIRAGKISKDAFMQWLYRKYPLRRECVCPAIQTGDAMGYPPVCRISFFRRIL